MRITFTFYFFLLSFKMMGQMSMNSNAVSNNPKKESSDKQTIRIGCLPSGNLSSAPLWIIDGAPVDFEKVKDIDPNNIESIDVLKDAAVSAIYCRAINGIIIITTKSSKSRQFQIKDFWDGSVVAGATVSFISAGDKKDTLMFTANDSGMLITDKLEAGEEYKMAISSAGFKTLSVVYKNIKSGINTFSLERDIISCDPVIVTAYETIRCRRISCCGWQTISDCRHVSGENIINKRLAGATVYPNPVQRGQYVTIEINSIQSGLLYTRVITLDGRQILSQEQKTYKGINRFFVNIDDRWSAGAYFFQVVDEKRNIIKQEKIIIQ